MNLTSIEWVKNPDGSQGYTWNPITGCLNHENGLCRGGNFPCYAYKLAHGRLKQRYLVNEHLAPVIGACRANEGKPVGIAQLDPFYPRSWEERLEQIDPYPFCNPDTHKPKGKGVFVCDMGDLFGIGVPENWTNEVLDLIERCPHDRFYLLTKQPQNLVKFSPFPDNCWVGVTATNFDAVIAATKWLKGVKANIKYLSLEPLLHWALHEKPLFKRLLEWCEVSWLIIGACTGNLKDIMNLPFLKPEDEPRMMKWDNKWTLQPKIEWVREIVEAAGKAGIKVFLKDNLRPLLAQGFGRYDKPWAFRNMEVRQELPNVK